MALQAEGVFARGVGQRAVGGIGVRAMQHGTAALVEQHIVARAGPRHVHGGFDALDFQADPACFGFRGVQRREQEEPLGRVLRRMQPDDPRLPMGSGADFDIGQGACQPFLDIGGDGGQSKRIAGRHAQRDGIAGRTVDHLGAGQRHALQIAVGQHQCPIVSAGRRMQRQDVDLRGRTRVGGRVVRGWGAVAAHGGRRNGPEQRFALVEELLRIIGGRVHVAAVGGHDVVEGPIQEERGTRRDAHEQGRCKKMQQQGSRAGRGLRFKGESAAVFYQHCSHDRNTCLPGE
ncbi:hypothetical protein D3C71_1288540 [compost metagenome]